MEGIEIRIGKVLIVPLVSVYKNGKLCGEEQLKIELFEADFENLNVTILDKAKEMYLKQMEDKLSEQGKKE